MKNNLIKTNKFRFAAFFLSMLLLLSFVGCGTSESGKKTKKVVPSDDVSSNVSENTGSSEDDISSETTDSSEGSKSSSKSKTTKKEFQAKDFGSVENVSIPRADANEVVEKVKSSNLYDPLTGLADDIAEKKKNEILNAKNTESLYKISGVKYYVSPGGNDSNDGKSPQKAIRTIDGINNLELKSGDAVLFERGSVFRTTTTILTKDGVTYGSYGEGDKPRIYASPANYALSNKWQPTKKKNVWQISFGYESVSSVVINNAEIVGILNTLGTYDLKNNGDFYFDEEGTTLYLYCDKGNPAKAYNSVEILPAIVTMSIQKGVSNVTIDNLCLKYSGAFAISAQSTGGNINITNCEIGYTGGLSNGKVRYGNAIEFWNGGSNINVKNNWIYQTFDSAITWQGDSGCTYENISFSNNLLEYNNADIEFFERKGAVVKNFTMDNNIMRFTSHGWGTRSNDAGVRGIEGCIRARTIDITELSNVSFRNNIIDSPARQIINWEIKVEDKAAITSNNNILYFNSKCRTSSVVIQGLRNSNTELNQLTANNLADLKTAFKRFDENFTFYGIS